MNDRRRFLVVSCQAAAVLGLAAIPLACSSPAGGPVGAGNVKDVPVGYLAFVGDGSVILGRDAGGLYAMTSLCPHQSCDMHKDGGISAGSVTCACHGSVFDRNGNAVRGPARGILEHYRVDLATDGSITVQSGTVVDAATRTKV
jgi:nitrite reductase/ring-hydroxylating ferredoxin subunit